MGGAGRDGGGADGGGGCGGGLLGERGREGRGGQVLSGGGVVVWGGGRRRRGWEGAERGGGGGEVVIDLGVVMGGWLGGCLGLLLGGLFRMRLAGVRVGGHGLEGLTDLRLWTNWFSSIRLDLMHFCIYHWTKPVSELARVIVRVLTCADLH